MCAALINVLEFRGGLLKMQTRQTFPYCAAEMFVSILISGLIGYKTPLASACTPHQPSFTLAHSATLPHVQSVRLAVLEASATIDQVAYRTQLKLALEG